MKQKNESSQTGKRRFHLSSFLMGVVLTALILSLAMPSVAALAKKTIDVYTGVKIYVDDQLLDPRDANGNVVEPFLYNGTTYLPVRAVSSALGKNITWEGSSQSVFIGKHTSDKPAVMLADLDYMSGSDSYYYRTTASEMDNYGSTHYSCIIHDFERTYILNANYSSMSGVIYQKYDQRSETIYAATTAFEIYGDGRLLYSFTLPEDTSGISPTSFNVDLTGVIKLKVVFNDGYYGNYGNTGPLSLGDCGLWS